MFGHNPTNLNRSLFRMSCHSVSLVREQWKEWSRGRAKWACSLNAQECPNALSLNCSFQKMATLMADSHFHRVKKSRTIQEGLWEWWPQAACWMCPSGWVSLESKWHGAAPGPVQLARVTTSNDYLVNPPLPLLSPQAFLNGNGHMLVSSGRQLLMI